MNQDQQPKFSPTKYQRGERESFEAGMPPSSNQSAALTATQQAAPSQGAVYLVDRLRRFDCFDRPDSEGKRLMQEAADWVEACAQRPLPVKGVHFTDAELLKINYQQATKIQELEQKLQQRPASSVLAALDALGDDAAVHIWPEDLDRCSRTECTAVVYSVRMGSPNGKTVPLFSREQVSAALLEASAQREQPADSQVSQFGSPEMQALILARLTEQSAAPVDMVLYCPKCSTQHIDAPDERTPDWTNPPHKSHLCHNKRCNHIWRPSDTPTNGVARCASGKDADTAPAASKPEPQAQAGEPLPASIKMPVTEKIGFYLVSGGLFNPELADHEKVRDLVIECRDAIATKDAALKALSDAASNAIGCLQAAETEGLHEALAESTDLRLKDLVQRRLMFAFEPLDAAITQGQEAMK